VICPDPVCATDVASDGGIGHQTNVLGLKRFLKALIDEAETTLMSATAEALSELIGAIYDCAIDPQNWRPTLENIRVRLGAENAALSVVDLKSRRFLLSFLDNVPRTWADRIGEWDDEILDAWGGPDAIRAMPEHEPFVWSSLRRADLAEANSYTNTIRDAGYGDAMSLVLARDQNILGACVFGRTKKAGRFSEGELALAQLLLPHAQRAIALSRMLELATLKERAYESVLDTLQTAALFVTESGDLVHANRAAMDELRDGEWLRLKESRLTAIDRRHHIELQRALATASATPNAGPTSFTVPLTGSAVHLELLPLPGGTKRATIAPDAAAAILFSNPAARSKSKSETLRQSLGDTYGLTPGEAAVAVEIAKGDGRAAVAKRLGIRESTVRTHLSAIFGKTGLNRQTQLVLLINQLG